jgi:twitching motility protein PilT
MDFDQLAKFATEQGASDIHLSPGLPPMLRVHGDMKEVHTSPMGSEEIKKMLHTIMTDEQKQEYQKEMELDFSISVNPKTRYRVNAYTTANGCSAAFRTIPVEIKSLAQLGVPAVFETFTQFSKGIVLVTGPTGSGKSTTLAGLINHINENEYSHIITIEDPIEFVHKSKKSLVNQREVGANTKSFAKALKSALRQDPDVILVGELRDLESISLALTAAETGHLVFATLHTSSAAKTIDRIVDVFPGSDKDMIRTMLSSSIQAVIAQRLLKKKDGTGRVAAYEILISNGAIRNLIRENKVPQINSLMQIGSKDGMCIMDDYIRNLYAQGLISAEEGGSAIRDEDVGEGKVQKMPSDNAANMTGQKAILNKKSEENEF